MFITLPICASYRRWNSFLYHQGLVASAPYHSSPHHLSPLLVADFNSITRHPSPNPTNPNPNPNLSDGSQKPVTEGAPLGSNQRTDGCGHSGLPWIHSLRSHLKGDDALPRGNQFHLIICTARECTGKTDRQTHRHTDRQTYWQTDRQTYGQTYW